MIESLEHRVLFNGTVRITSSPRGIHIVGDDAGNALALFRPDDGSGDPQFGITASISSRTKLIYNGKIITGENSSVDLTAKNGVPLTIDMGGGEDYLLFSSRTVFGASRIDLGAGNDRLRVDGQFESLELYGGAGDDWMTFFARDVVTGNAAIFPGAGRDRIYFHGFSASAPALFGGKLLIYDRQGPLIVTGNYLSVRREMLISTGESIDHITLTNGSFGRFATIGTRGGDDVIDLTNSYFRNDRDVLPGAGSNSVTG